MSKKLSKGERKKAVRALNRIKKELEEVLGEKGKSSGSSQSLDYSTNFCPVLTKKQIQQIADNVIGRKLKKEEVKEVVKNAYSKEWQKPLIGILKETIKTYAK